MKERYLVFPLKRKVFSLMEKVVHFPDEEFKCNRCGKYIGGEL